MRLSLRAGERIYVNGAVLRVDRRVAVELLNEATFLLEGHVLQAEAATTPLRQLYFAAQTMLIEPVRAEAARALFDEVQAGILAAAGTPALRAGLNDARTLVDAGKLFEALKLIRTLYPIETAVLTGTEPVPITEITRVTLPATGARRAQRGDAGSRGRRRGAAAETHGPETGPDTEA